MDFKEEGGRESDLNVQWTLSGELLNMSTVPKEESFSVNVMKGKFRCMLSMSRKVNYRWEMNYFTRLDLLG